MTEDRDIGFRLENWGRCYQEQRVIGVSPTGAFCDRIKRDKLGEQPTGERRRIDVPDAEAVERAICLMERRDVDLFVLCYIRKVDYSEICRKMRYPYRNTVVFIEALRQAQAKLQSLAGRDEQYHSHENFLTTGNARDTFQITT